MSIDPNNLAGTAHVTFDDEFNNLSLWNGSSGVWSTTFWYQDANGNGGTLASNGEQEWYINANYGPTSGVKPWIANNGVLTLTATPASGAISPLINGYGYTSGEINSYHSFSQTYGYFEMRAQLPAGQGFWPAFWLMPENGSWPPELDVVETIGETPTGLVTTVHSMAGGTYTKEGLWTQVPDTSAGYHTYGVDWEPDYITWYFDGQPVHQVATPSDLNVPMYIIANLADGGYWPGAASGATGQMNIDYIRAYASGPGSGGSPGSSGGGSTGGSSGGSGGGTGGSSSSVTVSDASYTAPAGVTAISLSGWNQTIQANNAGDTFYSNNSQNHLLGGAGNDVFYMGRAGDSAASGGGTDDFVFNELPWSAGHISGFTGQDVLDLSFLATYGYTGSNAIADGRVKLVSDGNGGTQVWADVDGLNGVSGTWLITTLDGISPANLSWQNGHLVDPPSSGGSTGSSGGGSSGSPGQTFTSDNNGDHWAGTAGNDTFNLGRGGDIVTGGGGADTFKFSEVPWAGGHITDFNAQDTLDLSAMFARYGYSGSSPLTDGHLQFVSDGQGGTQVLFDMDGLAGGSGTWLVTTLDHVAPSSLAISNGVVTEGAAGGGGSSTGGSTGQTFTSDNNGDHWTGTAGNDTFNLGRGGDVVTGGGGNDTFVFNEVPWARAEITDFHSGDQIDLSAMFAHYSYTTADPVADGRLKIVADGNGGSQIWFDADGLTNATGTWQLATLDHFAPSQLHVSGAFITG